VHNDEGRIAAFEKVAKAAGLTVGNVPPRMSSEDFGWILKDTPGFIFRFGTRNEATGCTDTAHKNTFKIDEEGMRSAIAAFIAYLMR
jgi:metal-dependent amidase/aminoacylase/carboxypeptidase family protein